MFRYDVAVIGGGGHVGLPLALTFAQYGFGTVIYDVNRSTVEKIRRGEVPFIEEGAPELLGEVLKSGRLHVDDTPEKISGCKYLVMIIGTPVDEHLNPKFTGVLNAIDGISAHLRDGQVLVLRSTVFPGISAHIQRHLVEKGLDIQVAFCPERVAEGVSLREIKELPQIVSGFSPEGVAAARKLFEPFNKEIIELKPMEAELTKLMTNAWRYIEFAVVNQFYMVITEMGLDFNKIYHACKNNYPRMAGMPGPGFAAGPCLVKDTMQLAAFCQNNFVLGHSAMLINEGLPMHIVQMAKKKHNLVHMTAGVLGMAFKAESDDPRDSLSYKLKKLLTLECKKVLCTDPYVRDQSLVPLEQVLAEADILFIGAPHKAYRGMKVPPGKIVYDVWSCIGTGVKKAIPKECG